MGEERKLYKILVGKLEETKERDHSKDQGVHKRMKSEWILRGLGGGCGVD
jgi:hypothetical protein